MGYQIYIFQTELFVYDLSRKKYKKQARNYAIYWRWGWCWFNMLRERERERERALIEPSTLFYLYVSCHIEQLLIICLFLCLQKLVDNSYILWTTCTATSFHLSKSKYMLTFVFVMSPESLRWPIALDWCLSLCVVHFASCVVH